MTSTSRHEQVDAASKLLGALRDRYMADGYSFEVEPAPHHVPKFLGGYKPDAIASKPGANVAIEVRQRQGPAADLSLQEIRRRFEGQTDWQFVVAYTGDDPLKTLTIPPFPVSDIRDRLKEVDSLAAQGQHRAAFILGWSLLEATLHSIKSASDARPHTPGTVVQTLTMLGLLDPQLEQRVRPLIRLRNRVVHGDLSAEPSIEDVRLVLSAVEEVLSEA